MNRYIVLHEDGCCGHKHRSIDRAAKCYDHFDKGGYVMARFLTNIDYDDGKLIIKAAKESNFDVRTALARDRYKGLLAVYTNEPLGKDHGPFWDVYDRLKGRK